MNIYFTRFHYVPVTLVASRTFHSFVQSFLLHSLIPLTSQLVLARAYGRLKILRGESGGGHAPFFVCAFFLAGSPRNPRTPARAHADARILLTPE
jgi:hypothetical protein